MSVQKMRAEREVISDQINVLRAKRKALSEKIRAAEYKTKVPKGIVMKTETATVSFKG